MKKRIFAVLLALVMTAATAVPAWADFMMEDPLLVVGDYTGPLDEDYSRDGLRWDSGSHTLELSGINYYNGSVMVCNASKDVVVNATGENYLNCLESYWESEKNNTMSFVGSNGGLSLESSMYCDRVELNHFDIGAYQLVGTELHMESSMLYLENMWASDYGALKELTMVDSMIVLDCTDSLYFTDRGAIYYFGVEPTAFEGLSLTDEKGDPVHFEYIAEDDAYCSMKLDGTPAKCVMIEDPASDDSPEEGGPGGEGPGIPEGTTYILEHGTGLYHTVSCDRYSGSFSYTNCTEEEVMAMNFLPCSACHYGIAPDEPDVPVVPQPPVTGNPFADVKTSDYFYEPVLWAVENGITSGMGGGKFAPNDPCTRGQVVTFLWRAAGQPEPTTDVNPFTDVKPADYFYKAVLWAVENGVTTGMGNGKFAPNAPCTRAQVVTFQWRAAGEPYGADSNPFYDVRVTNYFYAPVLWAVRNGVTSGTGPNNFSPDATCTRGQIATFLYRGSMVEPVPEVPQYSGQSEVEAAVWEQINQERTAVGLKPLTWDSKLYEGVKIRTNEYRYWSNEGGHEGDPHHRPNGDCYYSVFVEIGVGIAAYPSHGEILAASNDSDRLVPAWMNSPGHKGAILTEYYTHAAVCVVCVDGMYYACTIFHD